MTKKFSPVHPGKILLQEFILPLSLNCNRLASDIGVSPRRIRDVVNGKRAITTDTALRLSRYFGLSERFWINLQSLYDMEIQKDILQLRLEKEVKVYAKSRAA